MALNAHVSWAGDRTFIGRSGSGHSVIMDVDSGSGGHDAGFRPLEMLLLGMGGCTAYDVVDILEKGRQPVSGCVVELEAERDPEMPRLFATIRVRYIVSGPGLDADKVARAVKLSSETYCSATLMLGKSAEITHDIEIVDTSRTAEQGP